MKPNRMNDAAQTAAPAAEKAVRLDAFLASRGVASRRRAAQIIREGGVTINGRAEREPGRRISTATVHIKVNGKPVRDAPPKFYLVLNKPAGLLTTRSDPRSRPIVSDLLGRYRDWVQPVGRLDADSEGLLLFTNDGALAYKLSRPEFKAPKGYTVKVKGVLSRGALAELSEGIILEEGRTRPAIVRLIRKGKANCRLSITITEGKNRQIRRMCEAIGHPVIKLRRERYGTLFLKGLKPGRFRMLTDDEIQKLKEAVR